MDRAKNVLESAVGSVKHGKQPILFAYAAISLGFAAETTLSLAYQWPDLQKRFLAIEDFNFWVFSFVMHGYVACFTTRFYKLISVLERSEDRIDIFELSNLMDSIRKERNDAVQKFLDDMSKFAVIYLVMMITPSMAQSVYLIFIDRADIINTQDLFLAFEFYHLRHVTDSRQYFLYVILQTIVVSLLYIQMCIVAIISINVPNQKVILNIQLLMTHIKRFNEMFSMDNGPETTVKQTHIRKSYETKMKTCFSYIVQRHVDILREFNITTKVMTPLVHATLLAVTFVMCMLFYWISEVDDTWILKMKDFIQVLAAVVFTYYLSSIGQEVLNQSEKLRETVWNISWLGKPKWLHKSLLIMMAQCNRDMEIKPFGLYSINYRYFICLMSGTYSYYNVLRTINKK